MVCPEPTTFYNGGDGINDQGCVGGGCVFQTGGMRNSADDGAGSITTNNGWPPGYQSPRFAFTTLSLPMM